MKLHGILLLFLYAANGFSQTAEEQVLFVKSRLDSIETFQADIKLHVDISFIKMPDKEALAVFKKGEDLVIKSEDFVLIPKRGLDLSFSELFEYPFMVVDRGEVEGQSTSLRESFPVCGVWPQRKMSASGKERQQVRSTQSGNNK